MIDESQSLKDHRIRGGLVGCSSMGGPSGGTGARKAPAPPDGRGYPSTAAISFGMPGSSSDEVILPVAMSTACSFFAVGSVM